MGKNIINIGRKISYLLRHNPEDLSMDKNGWVKVSDLLHKLDITKSVLDSIVDTNDKKRYSYNDDMTLIRANQGHSINVDVELEEKIPPVVLYHGTSPLFIKSIMKHGLSKMNRQHVHLSYDLDTAMDVGERHSKNKDPEILIIDCKSMVKDGYKFYISNNGVWLTDHVPPKYLKLWE
jgi:putative RNA 2'-phosphotransferase